MAIEERKENDISSEISRYNHLDILRDGSGNEFIESWRDIEIPESNSDNYHEVGSGEVNRLDLIAYQYYNNARLWWIIALANNIKNPLILEVGDLLRVPSLDVVYGYGGVLS